MLHAIHVVNKKIYKGEGKYIGRGSPLGNIFVMHDKSNTERERVIKEYKQWLWRQINLKNPTVLRTLEKYLAIARKEELTLICWCAPKACHGDVIKSCLQWMDQLTNTSEWYVPKLSLTRVSKKKT